MAEGGASRLHPALRALAFLAGAGLVLLFVIPLAMRSLTMADEGYLLQQSLDMLNGKLLYRDMDAFVTPGIWFLLAGLFELTGPSVAASRAPVVVAYLAMIAASYGITARLAGRRYGLAAVALQMICTVWAFPAWTFAFYSPFAVTFALVGLERILAWRDSGARRDLVLAGVLFGLAIAFKQNYGVFALVGGALGVWAIRMEAGEGLGGALRRTLADGLPVAAGVAAVGLPLVAYFTYHGALDDAFQSLLVHPFEFSGKHDIAYLGLEELFRADLMADSIELMTYGAQPIYRTVPPGGWIEALRVLERLHVILYWIPPLIFIFGTTLALMPEAGEAGAPEERRSGGIDGGLLCVLAVAFLLFLGTFPRADFNHLINVYQPVVVAGVVSFHALLCRHPRPWRLWLRVMVGGVGLLLALYLAVAVYWYAGLMKYLNARVEGARGGVFIAPIDAAGLRFTMVNLDRISEPGGALLTVPDIAMLNFLSARPMPSAYYNLYEHHIAHDGGAAVVEGSEDMGVKVAITRYNDFFSDRVGLRDYAPALTRYLQTHFEHIYTIGYNDYLLFRRRPTPIEAERSVDVLEDCEGPALMSEVRRHLLFRSLYQQPGPGFKLAEAVVETVCRVRVPEAGGRLRLGMGYRKPLQVLEPATLSMEILIRHEDGAGEGDAGDAGAGGAEDERILSRIFDVETQDPRTYRFPALPESEVDLSEHAGRELLLVFRTVRSGRVRMSPTFPFPFGTSWQHPRIVSN